MQRSHHTYVHVIQSLVAPSHALQVDGNPSDSRSKKAILPTFPESPDSPLVFPWSQGPSSTGAASAYASLSDSYLSRPPSQAPSQAPSPLKQGQLVAASPAKHAQHEPAGASSPAYHAQSNVSSPSQISKRPLDMMWGASRGAHSSPVHQRHSPVSQVGSLSGPLLPTGRAFQAMPNGQVGSPSGPPLPTGHAFQSHSSGPLSNGPVSVAPWRQQPHSAKSTTAGPQSPPLDSPAATSRMLPPQLGSSAATSTLQISPSKLPPTATSHILTGEGQQPTKPASEASGDPEQFVDVAQYDTKMRYPWQQQRPASNGVLQPNGGRDSHDDAASSASGDSSLAPVSSHAVAPVGANAGVGLQELERRFGSTHTLNKGELLARVLDESLTGPAGTGCMVLDKR